MTVKHNQVLISLILTLSFINDVSSNTTDTSTLIDVSSNTTDTSTLIDVSSNTTDTSTLIDVSSNTTDTSTLIDVSSNTTDTSTLIDVSSNTTDTSTLIVSLPTTAGTPTSADSTCPGGVGLLGTEYTIVGDRSNYTGLVWVRPTDGRYVVTCNPSCSPVAGYRATLNATHSTLTIHSVGVADAGTWKIVDANVGGAIPVGVCQLTTAGSSSSRLSSTTPRSTTVNVVEGRLPVGALIGIVISIVIVQAIIVSLAHYSVHLVDRRQGKTFY
ncbi:serine-rich adhesin for platelets-like isoform X5 [Haliotis rufescens]|uniref:serine-rich adhesin for platelets-like isoform X5 n=1 Tax=Haliotis rufescens TaxID=6454 RepID=UPI00201F67DE|nr:serine-rich adhesin for platelets-like isoform X5 [Haliotis rufescens]